MPLFSDSFGSNDIVYVDGFFWSQFVGKEDPEGPDTQRSQPSIRMMSFVLMHFSLVSVRRKEDPEGPDTQRSQPFTRPGNRENR
jgi:hypothetical protein